MLNTLSAAQQPQQHPQLTLQLLWHVDADQSYHITRRMMAKGANYVAIRTLYGVGELRLTDGASCALTQGTLLLLPKADILQYHCKYDRWHFFWFEFDCDKQDALPFHKVMEIPVGLGEEDKLLKCFSALGTTASSVTAQMAQALFHYLMTDWLCKRIYPKERNPITAAELAQLLDKGLRQGLSVSNLAQEACMCERSFRMLVKQYTGKSPKEYMLHHALDAALMMLETTDLTIAEIAMDLGFCNAFYFSRAFKNRFGIQPSKARLLHPERQE